MNFIKSIINKFFVSKKTVASVTILSLLVVPFLPMTAFAVSDVTPPSVSISTPLNSATVSGTVPVQATASDMSIPSSDCVVTIFGIPYDVTTLQNTHSGGNVFVCGTNMTTVYQGQHGTNVSRMAPYVIPTAGISKVELYVDGVLSSTITSSPYNFSWDSSTVSNGTHTLMTKAYDLAGNTANASVTVIVNNTSSGGDTVLPTVSITSPANASTTSGTVNVMTSASDNVGVTKVELYVDGVLNSTDTLAPYNFSWNTTLVSNGAHTLLAKAYDAAGNIGTSTSVSVTVSNGSTGPVVKHDDDNGTEVENENESQNEVEHVNTGGNGGSGGHRSENEHHISRSSGSGTRVGHDD